MLLPVEKDVSLLDALLILSVLAVRSVSYHDTTHLIHECVIETIIIRCDGH